MAWPWLLARLASDGEDRLVCLDEDRVRGLGSAGEHFLDLIEGGLGASEDDDVAEGEAGGDDGGLPKSNGIESDELAAIELLWTEAGVVVLEEPGPHVGAGLRKGALILASDLALRVVEDRPG